MAESRGRLKSCEKTANAWRTALDVFRNPWLMCVTRTVFILSDNGDTNMANATEHPTSADLLYLHTQTLERIEELHTAVNNMPLTAAADAEAFDQFFDELDDLHDAFDGLAAKFRRNTTR